MRCEAAVLDDAEAPLRDAEIVLLGGALLAGAAADPGIDDAQIAERDAARLGAECRDPARDFMTGGPGQGHPALGELHHLSAAQIKIGRASCRERVCQYV